MFVMVGTVIFGILAAGFFCCVCCGYKSLKLAIDVIDASADFLAGTKRVLVIPGVFFFAQILCVITWVGAMMCVVSMNKITASDTVVQGKNLEWTDETKYMSLYMLFGILWICAWFEYASTFIVMVSASTYYFNSAPGQPDGSAEVMTGVEWAFCCHAGSIAIGAFIIAIIRFIRIVFVYLAQQAE
jgi:solute carrier family 44 (choline transporter-like protein), member 2/4/5